MLDYGNPMLKAESLRAWELYAAGISRSRHPRTEVRAYGLPMDKPLTAIRMYVNTIEAFAR
jgi:hypothetical protein